jgi:serine/threonine protein kinase
MDLLANVRVGKFFGSYYLQRLIGRGSFGSVYEAIHIPDGSQVALKVIPIVPGVKQAYEAEVAAYKVLSSRGECSPYVVCLLDYGFYNPRSQTTPPEEQPRANGRDLIPVSERSQKVLQSAYYLASEQMDGDMQDFIEISVDGWTSHPQAFIEMATSFIVGLDYIHQKGMAHRDIKPANMFYTFPEESEGIAGDLESYLANYDGDFRIRYRYGDLGFACTDASHATEISTDGVQPCKTENHTPFYFSPEGVQFQRQRRRELVLFIAQKADIWALGVSLWEIFFGHLPSFLEDLQGYEDLEAVLLAISADDVDEMFERQPVITDDPQASEKISRVLAGFLRPFAGERMTLTQAKQILQDS